jgi:hypothetical protein
MNIKEVCEAVKTWQVLVGVITSVALIVTTAFAFDNHFTKSKEFEQYKTVAQADVTIMALNFEQYKTDEELDRTRDRIWDTKDRIKKSGATKELTEKLRELENKQQKLEKKLNDVKEESIRQQQLKRQAN